MATTQTITKNLGGNRLGSGSKNNISLHAYNRSTHDLSRAWRSSMNVGTLVPFLKIVGLNGDTISIDLDLIVRTLPSQAPLYGSYKTQLDVFECPIRLYNGLLHNNMTKIGLNMDAVKLPKITLKSIVYNRAKYNEDLNNSQIGSDSLLNYLGLRGIGDIDFTNIVGDSSSIQRKFNAVPLLAYWDIYKCYYANKQEEKGAYICATPIDEEIIAKNVTTLLNGHSTIVKNLTVSNTAPTGITLPAGYTMQVLQPNPSNLLGANSIFFEGWNGPVDYNNIDVIIFNGSTYTSVPISTLYTNVEQQNDGTIWGNGINSTYNDPRYFIWGFMFPSGTIEVDAGLNIKTFDLQNIDDARIAVLQDTGLNNELSVNTLAEPYKDIVANDNIGYLLSRYHQHGLALKTYQSDLFENWLKTEWIDGTNGINKITAVDTSSGSFEIDALNLANKVYNMLNRIAVSGGSYEDWQEAVFSVEVNRRAESPVYCGGMSAEIMFNEVVSNAATSDQPLGTLAGKGGEHAKKGGHLEIRCSEPCYIIGIVSITPRVDYSQGNDWDVTELDTLNDIHKPALDGIGFEDLLQERMAFWGTIYEPINGTWTKLAAGKVPAWMNYQTAVNETHGTFAEQNNTMIMTLNRRYQYFVGNNSGRNDFGIADLTTYIDPAKYNYIFADSSIDSQNFWVQIGMGITARRVMSAKILPNL